MNKLLAEFNKLPTWGKVTIVAGGIGIIVYVWKSKGTGAPSLIGAPVDTSGGVANGTDGSPGGDTSGSGQGGSGGGGSGGGDSGGGSGGQITPPIIHTPTPTPTPTTPPHPVPTPVPTHRPVFTGPVEHPTPPHIHNPTPVPVKQPYVVSNATGSIPKVTQASYGSGAVTPAQATDRVTATQNLHNPDYAKKPAPKPAPKPVAKPVAKPVPVKVYVPPKAPPKAYGTKGVHAI